ncbi:PH domain-containing protein [Massilia sp. RP-1-19]|uniref:PH domain-containing protein n=1 Tax=Massilia polaris TaxID=2728846 RepID=A0A848HUC0_9BURK|nr:PH domain-containing protein [Massilia polaris]NML62288.1 PH domain-containing protein [Massilia polaris]
MASYVQKILSRDETITYQAKISVWSLAPLIVLGFFFLFLWGIGVIFFIAAYLKYISTELAITNKRVIAKFGFISRRTVEIKLSKVESMQVEQGILGRIFNFGSLVVAGAGTPQAPIPGISDPITFRTKFMETQEDAEAAAKVAA